MATLTLTRYLRIVIAYVSFIGVVTYLFAPSLLQSAALGMSACFIPSTFMLIRIKYQANLSVVEWLQGFKRAQAIKFVFTALILGMAFKMSDQWVYWAVITNYAVAIMVEALLARPKATHTN